MSCSAPAMTWALAAPASEAGVLHRDVKPENFGFATPLLDDVSEPLPALKLFDFGMGWVLPKAPDIARRPRRRGGVCAVGGWLCVCVCVGMRLSGAPRAMCCSLPGEALPICGCEAVAPHL